MLRFAPLLLLTAAAPHSGVVNTRTMPELSDIALFLVAVAGVWLARRALRARFRKQKQTQD